MSLSMYHASIPVFVRQLNNLSTILGLAASDAEARKIEPSVLLNARLAPDMFPLVRQVQIACDSAKAGVALLAGVEAPSHADDETSFAELQARIGKTLEFLQAVSSAQLDGSEARTVTLKRRDKETQFLGQAFLLDHVLPNFYFHYTTAYAILRHNGVAIGKRDFLGTR
ncbi:DUF1993 domain-containing protein [Pseudomonas lalucatii]|uniref:DUF1993 domain-containing protein n=1 Tax=Pseudomonas lalucatii TaxID=1424203 RepID=A0ABS5Q511_9PSED|nr:DUF1993 domain-containing protein [Pseudomonas lalucatii]MBS7663391.1 DUF1993 domain-containing protein [Pseudomonas lalucatii]MBS7689863.1 DUF1993 domain-containing protein [Pseudomonas lalucatii]QVM87038.1 DUF1993 domain-containing protein [Pseudomonas lalucatii]